MSEEAKRQADVYVFALLAHKDKLTIDPLDMNQWQFYVLPTTVLDACVFRGKPDTDSNSIRTAFRFRPDTVPIHIGQCSGLMSDSFWASLEWCPIWNGLLSG